MYALCRQSLQAPLGAPHGCGRRPTCWILRGCMLGRRGVSPDEHSARLLAPCVCRLCGTGTCAVARSRQIGGPVSRVGRSCGPGGDAGAVSGCGVYVQRLGRWGVGSAGCARRGACPRPSAPSSEVHAPYGPLRPKRLCRRLVRAPRPVPGQDPSERGSTCAHANFAAPGPRNPRAQRWRAVSRQSTLRASLTVSRIGPRACLYPSPDTRHG